jgi:Cu(I)/Ag(I) efflux system membrane fusion protein
MKRLLFLFIVVATLSCKNNENNSTENQSDSATVIKSKTEYTCPMHPEIISDKPGSCTMCGMDLEIKA